MKKLFEIISVSSPVIIVWIGCTLEKLLFMA